MSEIRDAVDAGSAASQVSQILLRLQYQQLRQQGLPVPPFTDVEFRCYSQNGEDGILLFLFALLGTTNRKVVEIGSGSGIECNAANLIVNHGWQGLLVDASARQIKAGNTFYARHKNTRFGPPTLVASWVTVENINSLISGNGFAGDIDLLSLDIDGNDYWIWRAIDCIQPRVVVLEVQALLGPEMSVTRPYDPRFRANLRDQPCQIGASLSAFVKLGRARGYRLIGVQSLGFNAFFVRAGLGEDLFPERSPADCYASVERLRSWQPGWSDAMFRNGQQWEEV